MVSERVELSEQLQQITKINFVVYDR